MTDSLKLAEMQRTSIEFERQRHLANWFIKSSPHMANSQNSSKNPNGCPDAGNTGKGGKNNGGSITTTNPLFFVMNGNHPGSHHKSGVTANGDVHHHPSQMGGNILMSRSQNFPFQSNLPLQIDGCPSSAAVHHQEGRKPKLRRFNSHDTSANMFSVADFENARLARRNEVEMKQRQQHHQMKLNSLSSGGDCSTGDSKGSKCSSDSQSDALPADVFLDRYSLPRVARISYKSKFSQETLQSSFSNGSSTTQSSLGSSDSNIHNNNNKHNCKYAAKPNGELFLLHRYIKQRKIYHALNSKNTGASRKKGFKIPQEYPGYFSLINEKGTPTATLYTTLIQLVRERVYKFISVDNLPAFTESLTAENYPARPHYVKTNARGGQVFRLLAVFEDGKQDPSTTSKTVNNLGREKEKGRYAQLLNENRQVLYVSLSTKGKFYEIEPGIPQLLQKVNMTDYQKKLNPDCVHRITTLINSDKEFPIHLKYISGPISGASNSLIPENIIVNKMSTEDVIIVCPIEHFENQSQLQLRKLAVTPEMCLLKCFLGFENEQRMLANQNVQNILKFCQFNCDQFLKMTEVETLNRPERSSSKNRIDGLKILKPLSFPKLLRREKSTIAHEKEDSIIFLSKNDLANMETKEPQAQQTQTNNQNRITERMKVFQSTKKKWFRRNDKHTSLTSLDLDAHSKRMSMERYNDMSKLVQERFGEMLDESVATNERTASEIGVMEAKPKTNIIHKSLSLQEVDFAGKREPLPNKLPQTNVTNGSVAQNDQSINELSEHQTELQNDIDDEGESDRKLQSENQRQSSFITEKLYNEFHVKTRQYSKSSSSLHQLLYFAVPQKMNVVEAKKVTYLKENCDVNKAIKFTINDPVSSNDYASSMSLVDDLPYSSVRDSLVCENESSSVDSENRFTEVNLKTQNPFDNDLNKENIYAEICLENRIRNTELASNIGVAVSRVQICDNSSILDHETSSIIECNISNSNKDADDTNDDRDNKSGNNLRGNKKEQSVGMDTKSASSNNSDINNDNIYHTLK